MSTSTTAGSPSPYEALPLSQGEIRVLEVAPASFDEPVECTMKRVSLVDDPVPAYETISYCWGAPRDPSAIKLNGRQIHVPANSEAAVRRMRLSDRPRVLWIDAICIDQSSVTERSAQVTFMTTVYSAAEHNLIYLGEDDDDMAESAVKALEDVMDDMRVPTAEFTLLHETVSNHKTGTQLSSNEPFSASVDLKALEALLSHHWFRRLWVLQEAVLASSNTCHWGTYTFDLLDTVRAAAWLMYRCHFISDSLFYCDGLHCAIEMFELLCPDHRFTSRREYLASMFMTIRHFEKTEPKDSIFAILGLLDKNTSLESSQVALLEVDYVKSLSGVLRDATRYSLCQKGDLRAFNFINHRFDVLTDCQSFPTWAIRADLQQEVSDAVELPYHFDAGDGLEAPSLLDDVSLGEEVVLLQGIVVDEVYQTTASCLRSTWENKEEFNEWLISVRDTVLRHCNVASQEELFLATAFALVAGATWGGRRAQSSDLQVLLDYFKSSTSNENDAALDGIRITKGLNSGKMKLIYENSATYLCSDRRFFVTESGRVGIGPRCMQPGDIVVVLRGGNKPFILRKKVDGYWLLGQAYVHGIMDGEAVQIHKARGGSEEVFHIR
ncbi:heterokaryon incompatibility protein-domain-containing protein [Alternaria rosae]|uniref:heterokaryon incompatibility protein-domain-containing protein n=1 Tax=Alternaria rosae TaxID=1187941 RepID=UPI001E8CBA86|nr:heterokaryon incompatibility protein-domain-containing protein [Alternaria rosae]KAH6866350.1 heterokaryon incompatibility protein-domain-containing protein [Alternaria rosae]